MIDNNLITLLYKNKLLKIISCIEDIDKLLSIDLVHSKGSKNSGETATIFIKTFPTDKNIVISSEYYALMIESDEGYYDGSMVLLRKGFKEAIYYINPVTSEKSIMKILSGLISLLLLVQGFILLSSKETVYENKTMKFIGSIDGCKFELINIRDKESINNSNCENEILTVVDFNKYYTNESIRKMKIEEIFTKFTSISLPLSKDILDEVKKHLNLERLNAYLEKAQQFSYYLKINNKDTEHMTSLLQNYLERNLGK